VLSHALGFPEIPSVNLVSQYMENQKMFQKMFQITNQTNMFLGMRHDIQ
jgi:hypothetical protein